MNNLSKHTWFRGWFYIIIQNAILIGMPLIPVFYYSGNFFSLDPNVQVGQYSSFFGGMILHYLTRMIFEATGVYDKLGVFYKLVLFQLGFITLKLVIFNLLFFVIIKKQRFIYSSVFLNAALAIWALAVGGVILMLHMGMN